MVPLWDSGQACVRVKCAGLTGNNRTGLCPHGLGIARQSSSLHGRDDATESPLIGWNSHRNEDYYRQTVDCG